MACSCSLGCMVGLLLLGGLAYLGSCQSTWVWEIAMGKLQDLEKLHQTYATPVLELGTSTSCCRSPAAACSVGPMLAALSRPATGRLGTLVGTHNSAKPPSSGLLGQQRLLP